MDEIEYRFAEGVTVVGRALVGTVMPYGQVADGKKGPEKFLAGAFGDVANVDAILNLQHDRKQPLARTGGGGVILVDAPEALTMTATLPETAAGNDAVALVTGGVMRGLSVEFAALRERREAGVRVIERAVLLGIGLVDRPAYPAATVEARQGEAATGADVAWWQL